MIAADILSSVQSRFGFNYDPVSRHGVTLLEKIDPSLGAVIVGSRVKGQRIEFWINGEPGIEDSALANDLKIYITAELRAKGIEDIELGFSSNPFA